MAKNRGTCGLCLVIIIILLLWLAWPFLNPSIESNLSHHMHGKLTGQDAISDSSVYGVGGTDLGIIVKHNSQYCFLFGDTFSSTTSMTGNWRSNTMAISEDTDPSDGITIDSWILEPGTAFAKELIPSLKVDNVEKTCIPTAALSLNGNLYIYYMSVRHWSDTGGLWTCNNASIAVSLDDGQTFSKMSNISWDGDSNFVQFGTAQPYSESDDYLYLLGTPAGRFGSCYLCRVNFTQILNITAYNYFSGISSADDVTWSNEISDSTSIFPYPVGEVSVMWNDYLSKWTAFYTDNEEFSIVLRTSDNLWGPWSEPVTIVDAAEYPSLYGSYVHPDFIENEGEVVYFIMSIFSEYNTFVMSVNVSSLAT